MPPLQLAFLTSVPTSTTTMMPTAGVRRELRRMPLPRTPVNKGMEKGRGCQQVSSPRAPEARLARLVPGERAVHPLRRGRRWEFAGRGRGEGLEEVADQPVGALGCVFGGGGDDSGVGHQQQWDVFGHEVLSEAPGGLGPLDQLRDSVVDAVPLRPEFASVGEGLGQDVAKSAITLLHAGYGDEVVAEASPRIRAFQSAVDRFGVGGELGAEGRNQQVLPSRKAAVQGGDADSGPAGDFFGGSVQPPVGEDLPCGLQEQSPVAFGISAQLLTTADAAVVPLHVTDPTIKWNDRSRSCTLEVDRLVHLCNTIGRSITRKPWRSSTPCKATDPRRRGHRP